MSAASADPSAAALLRPFSKRLGYVFVDESLLGLALTHRSWCAENPGYDSNERLEFLGDAVLGLVVTDHIYSAHESLAEGQMAKVRASVVSSVALASMARDLDLGEHLLLGKGEDSTGGRQKSSILADAMEAVIGAVHLDGGIDASRNFVLGLVGDRIAVSAKGPGGHDFKTQLQELAAKEHEALPAYELDERGPDHDKRFYATVTLAGAPVGKGEGRSKKEAQQDAARAAWERLADHDRGRASEPEPGSENDG